MTTANRGRSLELYFINGNADGMLTAEVFNWTGHVLVAPRTDLGAALKRPEASFTGIYLLLGEQNGEPLAYIGEGENIANRIRNHDANRDWWTKVVMVTTGANNLNKAHVKYLESRLIRVALDIGRIPLENGNAPTLPSLSEAAQSNMEGFLEYLFIVLPAIGVDMFVTRERPTTVGEQNTNGRAQSESPTFVNHLKKHDITATAKLVDGEFVVLAGSQARKEWEGMGAHHYRKMFEELVRSGVLVVEGDHRVFSKNYAFSSPSAAGAMVTGRSCNGQEAWKVNGTTKTYRDWEQETLDAG